MPKVEEVIELVEKFVQTLKDLKQGNYHEKITEISHARRKMYNSEGKNIL